MGTDSEWEKWGQKDPYFGVKTEPKFRKDKLDEKSREDFFSMGRKEIEQVYNICKKYIDPDFSPKNVLEFGCGVGRLLIPLAQKADRVTGLDVSDSMLSEVKKNCREFNIDNITLLKSDDKLSKLEGTFDFIHSFIVFQHLEVKRGTQLISQLIDYLEEGGVGSIHVTYSHPLYKHNNGVKSKNLNLKILKQNIAHDTKVIARKIYWHLKVRFNKKEKLPAYFSDPEMQMNFYNINELLFIIQSAGINKMHIEFTDHGYWGVQFFFQKPKQSFRN
jgi:SAM-dependent methyltransferase